MAAARSTLGPKWPRAMNKPTADLDLSGAFVERVRVALARRGGVILSVTFKGAAIAVKARHPYGRVRLWKGRALSDYYAESARGIVQNAYDLAIYFLAAGHVRSATPKSRGPMTTDAGHKCDKVLDNGARRCNEPATLFYRSEAIGQIAARCASHVVIPYKPELGRLLTLTADQFDEYARELTIRDGMALSPIEILERAAALLAKTGFAGKACAAGHGGERLPDVSIEAIRFCVSGAARAVGFRGVDGDGSPQEIAYLTAMDAFCKHVGSATVAEWADAPGRSTDEACKALRGAADDLRKWTP